MNTPKNPKSGCGGASGRGRGRPSQSKKNATPVVEDPFITSEVASGNGNLFVTAQPTLKKKRAPRRPRTKKSANPTLASPVSELPAPKVLAPVDHSEAGNGEAETSLNRPLSCHRRRAGDNNNEWEEIQDEKEYDEQEEEFVSAIQQPEDGQFKDADGVPIGPYHHSVPQAHNTMYKYRNKQKSGPHPNSSRMPGRRLVMWHRARMVDKLVLCIQYECQVGGIKIPWDKVAHRLKPGASGPSIIQFLNKSRDVLVGEGHMIPPNMGKSKAVYDDTVRGYVRDMSSEIPTDVRSLSWNEEYEDRKESLDVPGMVQGSGRYARTAQKISLPKPQGRRVRVPLEVQKKMDEIREENIRNGRRVTRRKPGTKTMSPYVKVEDGPDSHEIDPADMESDASYTPPPTPAASNSVKRKAAESSRRAKRSRISATVKVENTTDTDDEESVTPQAEKDDINVSGKSSVGAELMADLSVETPTRSTRKIRVRFTTKNTTVLPNTQPKEEGVDDDKNLLDEILLDKNIVEEDILDDRILDKNVETEEVSATHTTVPDNGRQSTGRMISRAGIESQRSGHAHQREQVNFALQAYSPLFFDDPFSARHATRGDYGPSMDPMGLLNYNSPGRVSSSGPSFAPELYSFDMPQMPNHDGGLSFAAESQNTSASRVSQAEVPHGNLYLQDSLDSQDSFMDFWVKDPNEYAEDN